jgi:hypothetical protein
MPATAPAFVGAERASIHFSENFTMADAELAKKLRLANGKKEKAPMFFTFFQKGIGGKLILTPKPLTKDELKTAKAAAGNLKELVGKCFGNEAGRTVFKSKAKVASPDKVETALNKVAKDAGYKIEALIPLPTKEELAQIASEEGGAVAAEAAAPEAAPAAAPAERDAAARTAPETRDAAAGESAATARVAAPEEPETPPTPKELAVLEDRRRDFKKARSAWVRVKTQAEEDLEKVKDGAKEAYLADGDQFPKIVKGCKDIDNILDNLDDELRDTLDQYASTPLKNQNKLRNLAATATAILDRYVKYVDNNPVMKAIDEKEFADVTIHAPIRKALADLRKALS